MKIISHQFKAVRIYKRLRKTEKDFLEDLKNRGVFDQFKKKYLDALKEEKIDDKTAYYLKKLLIATQGDGIEEKIICTALETLEKIMDIKTDGKNGEQILLVLTSDGDLYKEPRKKYCYKMGKMTKQLAILKIMKSTYMKTGVIRGRAKIINDEAVRKYIGTFRQKAQDRLGLKSDIIESNGKDGYRINPLYKLIKE